MIKTEAAGSTRTLAISTKLHRSHHYRILLSYALLSVMCKRMRKVISRPFSKAELPRIPWKT